MVVCGNRIARYLAQHAPNAGERYAIAAKVVTIVSGGISLILAAWLISPVLLGYYYSFLSIAVWRTAADGGMSYLLVRFVAHEWGHVSDNAKGDIARARLSSLVRMAVPVYLSVALLFGLGTYLLGQYWFAEGPLPKSQWQTPLIVLSIVMVLNMATLPMRAFLEGMNDVATSNRGTLVAAILGIFGFSVMLLSGHPLYAVPLWFFTLAAVSGLIWLPALKPIWRIVRSDPGGAHISWSREFWPLQWRLILSTAAGLALFQLFVPIAFRVLGPVSAGRIGVALQVQQAIDQLGSVWVQARTPTMAILAARHQFKELRELAWRTNIISIFSASLAALGLVVMYLVVTGFSTVYASKFAGPATIIMFFLTSVLLQPAHVETAVVRCQKREPFVLPTVAIGSLMVVMTIVLAKLWGEVGIAAAFLICNGGILMPITWWISTRVTPR